MSQNTNDNHGLSQSEVQQRRISCGYNELPSTKARSIWAILFGVIREPMFLLLVACGTLYLILGDLQEALMLLGFVFMVMGITLYQERKTERALDALRDLSSPRALVIRAGVRQRIPGREVVLDDLLVLVEGDRVPADSYVLESSNLSIDESLLTGESVPVHKQLWDGKKQSVQPGGDDLPFVYSGSLVVGGNAIVLVYAIGELSELGKIGKSLQSVKEEETKLSKETGRLVKNIAIIGACLCVLVGILYYLTRGNIIEAFLTGLTLAMAILPEEFPVVLTVFLALGAWRMSRKNVLTRRMPAIETLGSATVLCTDKTGTLTYNRMTVQRIWTADGYSDIGKEQNKQLPAQNEKLLLNSVLSSMKDPFDPMEKAIHEALTNTIPAKYQELQAWQIIKEYPLSNDLRAMTNVWQTDVAGEFRVAAKGSPEAIIGLCRMASDKAGEVLAKVTEMAEQGLRVLGVAIADYAGPDLPDRQEGFSYKFCGLIGFADPCRDTVPGAVQECYKAGIRIIMITGDYPCTAKAIGRTIGLKEVENVITGEELNNMSDDVLAERIMHTTIFARVVPEQKLRIVKALKANGEIVAMTGDGVNDAPALKAANIGIAMGQRGTDVAREASSLVLIDDDFSSIVSAVKMGRRVFDNLQKAIAYILSIHVPIAGMALLPVLIKGYPLVFLPIHIVFLELIIDPACSVVFEMEKEEADVMERPPRGINEPLFGKSMVFISLLQGFSVLAILIAVYFIGLRLGRSTDEVRAFTYTTLVFSNIGLIITNRSWRNNLIQILKTPNPAMMWLVIGVLGLIGLITHVPGLNRLFHFYPLHAVDLAICLGAGLLSIMWFEALKMIQKKHRNQM
ncbi:MAG: ATPase [Candidatus Cloacimonetes bacterium HGW-Cloacimonetes-1]|jgi:Ca2+-transporting ATPase|nr:MAG: ATPase [Candidatus Cloacimonetes bacterium HGW-Cloacimonetes-1]